jgi:tRNA (guanine10-N2)-methyltransferase
MEQEVFKYDLKKRHYIGPTSLDHTLAIIMANVSHVKKGSVVLDPFVGTASLLVLSAMIYLISMN